MSSRLSRLCLAALLVLAVAPARAGAGPGSESAPTLAIIVNPRNPVTNVSFNELRAYLKLEQQFWPNKKRIELFLRPSSSKEMKILLAEVYRMTSSELRKYWVGKVFRGEISSKPGVVPTAKSARTRILKVPSALTVVMFDEVPEGVRVLTVDGKRPGDAGYPLVLPAGREASSH